MNVLLFLDILAYNGAAIGVLFFLLIGLTLLRRGLATQVLSLLIGSDRAQECSQDGSFRASQARALGTLFLFFASFIAVCIVRALQHG